MKVWSSALVEFWNKRTNGFKSVFLRILTILMEILSWPWASTMFKALILRISFSLKSELSSLESKLSSLN